MITAAVASAAANPRTIDAGKTMSDASAGTHGQTWSPFVADGQTHSSSVTDRNAGTAPKCHRAYR
jgi:hypothetical protein